MATTTQRRRGRPVWVKKRQAAIDRANAVRGFVPAKPAGFRPDGSPIRGEGQAYAVSRGKVYHPGWCISVADVWDRTPKRLAVIDVATAGDRSECLTCARGDVLTE